MGSAKSIAFAFIFIVVGISLWAYLWSDFVREVYISTHSSPGEKGGQKSESPKRDASASESGGSLSNPYIWAIGGLILVLPGIYLVAQWRQYKNAPKPPKNPWDEGYVPPE